MIKKSKRFEPVRKVAENRETAAALRMNQSATERQAAVDQLETLRGYRGDYVAQFKTKGQNGIAASRLQDYLAFVQKLDRAIEGQVKVVQSMEVKVSEHQQAFKKTNSRKKIVENLIEKSKVQEIADEGRKEQNTADDRVFKGFSLD